MIKETVTLVKAISATVESLRTKMNELASQLPEYHEVMSMYGAGKSTGPQLMAEIGDMCPGQPFFVTPASRYLVGHGCYKKG